MSSGSFKNVTYELFASKSFVYSCMNVYVCKYVYMLSHGRQINIEYIVAKKVDSLNYTINSPGQTW